MDCSYEYEVKMSCGGCASTVQNVLKDLPNIRSVETSLEQQKVTVTTTKDVTFEQVKLAIEKAGKQVNGGQIL